MNGRTLLVIAVVIGAAGLLAGLYGAGRARHPHPQAAVADVPGAPAAPPGAIGMAVPPPGRIRRFNPPPVPDMYKPLSYNVDQRAITSERQRIDRTIDEILGSDFPQSSREKILDAQVQWLQTRKHIIYDYYSGYIDQEEADRETHLAIVAYARACEPPVMTAQQYEQFFSMPPGTDPWMGGLRQPGVLAGTPMNTNPGHEPTPTSQP